MPKNNFVKKKYKRNKVDEPSGSWKLAYADFTTALMAFFLLLWLLNATPQNKLKSVADYFMPTLSIFHQKESTDKLPIKYGSDPQGDVVNIDNEDPKQSNNDNQVLVALNKNIQSIVSSDRFLSNMVEVSNVPEGLRLDLFPTNNNDLFYSDGKLTDNMKKSLSKLANIINLSPNSICILAYTSDNIPNDISNNKWLISAVRADNIRSYLENNGLPGEKISMIVGKADSDLVNPEKPEQNINNRATIILLKKDFTAYYKLPTP